MGRTPILTPIYYYPYCGDPRKGTCDSMNPPFPGTKRTFGRPCRSQWHSNSTVADPNNYLLVVCGEQGN